MCPYLVPVVADRLWQVPVPAYCRRADAGIRVPARSTLLSMCATERFAECAGYRRAAAAGATADGSRARV